MALVATVAIAADQQRAITIGVFKESVQKAITIGGASITIGITFWAREFWHSLIWQVPGMISAE